MEALTFNETALAIVAANDRGRASREVFNKALEAMTTELDTLEMLRDLCWLMRKEGEDYGLKEGYIEGREDGYTECRDEALFC